jgi:hypothetical protein
MQKFSKEQIYILSSIDYYGYAILTKDEKSKVWEDAMILVDMGYIKKKSVHFRTVIFIPTDKMLEMPLGFKNRRYSAK